MLAVSSSDDGARGHQDREDDEPCGPHPRLRLEAEAWLDDRGVRQQGQETTSVTCRVQEIWVFCTVKLRPREPGLKRWRTHRQRDRRNRSDANQLAQQPYGGPIVNCREARE